MQIECLIRRPGGTTVEFSASGAAPAAVYRFAPLDASVADSPHVATVEHAAHVERLVSIVGGYRAVGAATPAMLPLPRAAALPAAPIADGAEARVSTISAIRDLSVRDLKARINTLDRDDLRAALAAATADTHDPPSKGWVETIVAHLGD